MKEKVLNYLNQCGVPKGPTEIGLALGKTYNSASSSVSKSLFDLCRENKVERVKMGGKVMYKIKLTQTTA